MTAPAISALGLLVAAYLLVAYGALAALALRRLGARPDSTLALAVGGALLVAAGGAGALADRLGARLGLPDLRLDALAAALCVLPVLAGAALLVTGAVSRPPARRLAHWSLPALALTVGSGLAVLLHGVVTVFRSDAAFRADAVKELVWSNVATATDGTPALETENIKYAGYLAARAALTTLEGGAAAEPSLAWLLVSAATLAAGVFALARALGLAAPWAAVAVVAAPLLGGDVMRIGSVGDPRSVAAAAMLAGIAVVARATDRRCLPLAAAGGLLAGSAAVVHLQYAVVVPSVLVPAALIAAALAWRGGRRPAVVLAVACLCLVPGLALGLASGTGVVRSSSLAEAALERQEGADVVGRSVLAAGETVLPPAQVQLSGVDLIYVSPRLFILDPRVLVTRVWGERTAPLLALVGLLAALALARAARVPPLLPVLLGGTLAVVALVLLNPVVMPVFDRFMSVQRAQYIGFELGYVAVAAVAAAAWMRPRLGVPLALVALLAAAPVAQGNFEHRRLIRAEAATVGGSFVASYARLAELTSRSDLIVAFDDAWGTGRDLQMQRTFVTSTEAGAPLAFTPGADPETVLAELAAAARERRVVLLLSPGVAETAPTRILIARGAIPAIPAAGAGRRGVFWTQVTPG